MKKLSFKLAIASLVVFGTISALPAFAALVVTPSRIVSAIQDFSVNCTDDADFFGIYNNSSKVYISGGECDGDDQSLEDPGTYNVLVSDTDISSIGYYSVTVVEQANIQVVPDFTSDEVSTDILGSSSDDLVTGVGTFLLSKLPTIIALLGALIGLGFLLARVRKWIGKRA